MRRTDGRRRGGAGSAPSRAARRLAPAGFEVIYRSRGRLAHLRVPPRLQAALACLPVLLAGWLAYATDAAIERMSPSAAEIRAAALEQRLAAVEAEAAAARASAEGQAAAAAAGRRAAKERERFLRRAAAARRAALEQRLGSAEASGAALAVLVARASREEIARLEGLLEAAGVPAARLLGDQAVPSSGQGGPFEAAAADGAAPLAAAGLVERLEDLRDIVSRLPLSPPLDSYRVTSAYGKRKDPVNGRPAFHRGLDLGTRYRAAVRAPARGVVTAAGWNGRYGRFVEIAHDNGIATRYGHLRRIVVKRGQKVSFRDRIGEVGSSGRSTGTHLHYEILVDGKNIDPARFLEAIRHVFKG